MTAAPVDIPDSWSSSLSEAKEIVDRIAPADRAILATHIKRHVGRDITSFFGLFSDGGVSGGLTKSSAEHRSASLKSKAIWRLATESQDPEDTQKKPTVKLIVRKYEKFYQVFFDTTFDPLIRGDDKFATEEEIDAAQKKFKRDYQAPAYLAISPRQVSIRSTVPSRIYTTQTGRQIVLHSIGKGGSVYSDLQEIDEYNQLYKLCSELLEILFPSPSVETDAPTTNGVEEKVSGKKRRANDGESSKERKRARVDDKS